MSIDINKVLKTLGITGVNMGVSTGQKWFDTKGAITSSSSPDDGKEIAKVKNGTLDDYEMVIKKAQEAFKVWKLVPAPERGEIVRQIGLELRKYKDDLSALVSYEMGKIIQEGKGEVQEMIDICDFAVGQSRLINGVSLQSERREHRLFEQYQP
jgi:aldehyde dehydrogenase (NAD+)